jgi:superfamily II DNA/RNA helicase
MENTFEALQISTETQKALTALNYTTPTQVQQAVISTFAKGQDLLVKSQTGSGKTAAFAIPLVENIVWEERRPQAIVLAPTREHYKLARKFSTLVALSASRLKP